LTRRTDDIQKIITLGCSGEKLSVGGGCSNPKESGGASVHKQHKLQTEVDTGNDKEKKRWQSRSERSELEATCAESGTPMKDDQAQEGRAMSVRHTETGQLAAEETITRGLMARQRELELYSGTGVKIVVVWARRLRMKIEQLGLGRNSFSLSGLDTSG